MAENKEVERKFLVKSDAFLTQATTHHHITQGYLCKEAERTIRVRICDERAFLTIKSSSGQTGIARFEWEKEIDLGDARQLMELCLPGRIEKTRYILPAANGRRWEVDVFHGRLEGRVLAEIELGDEQESFARPDWLGEEVTGQPEFYNANM